MNGRQQLGLAIAAAAGGLCWGYLRHRGDPRAAAFAVIQAARWFVAYGGAAIVLEAAQAALERTDSPAVDDFEVERITRTRQIVTERTGTDG